MSDASLHTVRPKHSRSTSITTSKKTTSHQRKPSFTQQQLPVSSTTSASEKRHSAGATNNRPTLSSHGSATSNKLSTNSHGHTGPRFLNSIILRVHTFLKSFGPTLTTCQTWKCVWWNYKAFIFRSSLQSRVVRFFALFYVIFSVFLSLNHSWKYMTRPKVALPKGNIAVSDTNKQFGPQWKPQRTYDQDQTYSLLTEMTHGLRMHKSFSKSHYEAAKQIQPFWLKAKSVPENDEVTVITTATADTWDNLVQLTAYWEGPISAIVHVEEDDTETIARIQRDYEITPELYRNVDIHLAQIPGDKLSVLFPRNAERNLARLLAQTDYIMDIPAGVIPATDLRRTLELNKAKIDELLRAGDILALPTFNFKQTVATRDDVPYEKDQLIIQLGEQKMYLDDKHWKENEGPTDLEKWMDAETLYAIEKYEFHYEPVVIESKTIQPWCSERFLDSRAACIFSSYLQGNEIYVLPFDFMVQMPKTEEQLEEVTDFDNVVENRIYAKFYWEQCVHHARQLDALGLWKTSRSQHIRSQCSRVIQNWGKGLIGKPE
ncbi:unnamed protein product [Mucor hiemalis]